MGMVPRIVGAGLKHCFKISPPVKFVTDGIYSASTCNLAAKVSRRYLRRAPPASPYL